MKLLFVLLFPLLFLKCKKEDNISNSRIKTIIIGSSIASGVGATDYVRSWAGLITRDNSDDAFINYSVSGYTTFQFLPTNFRNFPVPPDTTINITAVLKQNPDIVLVSITSNDIANGYNPVMYIENMKVLTDTLKKHSIKYLITSTTLRGDLSVRLNDSLLVISNRLKDRYENKYVDIMSAIGDTIALRPYPHFYASDRIHPNNAGHAQIYSRINMAYKNLKQ
jgi:lysophospholipase L1-like esterase